jgi:hypothetical protein
VGLAGSDAKRQAAKWRCPTAECAPASCWIKADRLHTLIPRGSRRWRKLYRLRGAVERENGRLKNEWALSPLRVRRIERVRLHANLTILARLATALAKARAVPLVTLAAPPREVSSSGMKHVRSRSGRSSSCEEGPEPVAAALSPYAHSASTRQSRQISGGPTMTPRRASSFAGRIAGPS